MGSPILKARITMTLGPNKDGDKMSCERINDFQEYPAFTVKQKVKNHWMSWEGKYASETSEEWDFKSMAGDDGIVELTLSVEPLGEGSDGCSQSQEGSISFQVPDKALTGMPLTSSQLHIDKELPSPPGLQAQAVSS